MSDTEHALGHIIDGDTLDIEAGSGAGGEDLDVFLDHGSTGYREALGLLALEHDVAARNDGDGGLVIQGQRNGGGAQFSVTANHLDIDNIPGHSGDQRRRCGEVDLVLLTFHDFDDLIEIGLVLVDGHLGDCDSQFGSPRHLEHTGERLSHRTPEDQCIGSGLDHLAQDAMDVEADTGLPRIVTTDGSVLPYRFGAQFGGVDAEGDFALPTGENFAGESPATAASARLYIGNSEYRGAGVGEAVGVFHLGALKHGAPVMGQLVEGDAWTDLRRGRWRTEVIIAQLEGRKG